MKKLIIILAQALLMAACSGNGSSSVAPDYESSEPVVNETTYLNVMAGSLCNKYLSTGTDLTEDPEYDFMTLEYFCDIQKIATADYCLEKSEAVKALESAYGKTVVSSIMKNRSADGWTFDLVTALDGETNFIVTIEANSCN